MSSWEGIESASATIMVGLTFYLTLAREGEGREGGGREGEGGKGDGGRGREGRGGREGEGGRGRGRAGGLVTLLLECACGQG